MEKVNKLLVCSLVTSVFLISGCDNVLQNDEDYLKKGADLLAKGDYASAELELKNAIQKNPDVADSYYYMALLNEKGRNFKAMRMNLQEFLKLKPEHTEGRIKLAKVQLLFNEVEQALAEVETVLDADTENLEALTVKAQIYSRQQKDNEAAKIISEVLKRDPKFIDALAMKAVFLLKQKSYDESLSTINQVLSLDEENISFHLLKIRLYRQIGDSQGVISSYQALMKKKPDNDDIKYALVKAYSENGDDEKAEDLLRSLVKSGTTKSKLILLEFLANKKNIDAAIDELNIFVNNSSPADKIDFARWLLTKRNILKAKDILEQSVSEVDDNSKVKYIALHMLASLDFQQGKYDSASTIIERILKINPDYVDAKILKAEVFLKDEDYYEAEKLLNNILWENPKSDKSMVLLAEIYSQRGEFDKANNKRMDALKVNPSNFKALYPIANIAVKKKQYNYAKELVQKAILKSGQRIQLLQMLAKISFAEKNWEISAKILELIDKKNKQVAQLLYAQMYEGQEDYQRAIRQYKSILNKYPWHSASLVGIARSYEELNNRAELIEYLGEFIKNNPNNSYSYLIKSNVLVLDDRVVKAVDLLEKALLNNINSASIYNGLAKLYIKQGRIEDAIKVYKKGLEYHPKSILLISGLAGSFESIGDYKLAIDNYERALKINNKLDVVKNNLASILVADGGESSLLRAAELISRFKESEQPYFLDTYAWVKFKQGDDIEALKALKNVVVIAPDVPVFRYHLAEVYNKQGDRSSAVMELRQALELAKNKEFSERNIAKSLLQELLSNK